jgi:hypothetical protein
MGEYEGRKTQPRIVTEPLKGAPGYFKATDHATGQTYHGDKSMIKLITEALMQNGRIDGR